MSAAVSGYTRSVLWRISWLTTLDLHEIVLEPEGTRPNRILLVSCAGLAEAMLPVSSTDLSCTS